MRIVETDNYDGDYPGETFVNVGPLPEDAAKELCDLINKLCSGDRAPRYWKVVPNDYELNDNFEP